MNKRNQMNELAIVVFSNVIVGLALVTLTVGFTLMQFQSYGIDPVTAFNNRVLLLDGYNVTFAVCLLSWLAVTIIHALYTLIRDIRKWRATHVQH